MSAEGGPVGGFQPSLRYDSDSSEFVRGFEAGRFWALLLENPDQAIEGYMHASNTGMALRIAEATQRQAISQELDDGWLFMTFSPRGQILEDMGAEKPRPI